MNRLGIILGTLLFSVSFAEERPNVLLIVIDDLNDYVGCLGGHPDAKTPHIDALAERGVLFTNAHCNSPVCNPSRASLWTGLHPHITGITTNHSGFFRDLAEFADIVTLPQAVGAAGYRTIGLGKLFHLGHGNRIGDDWQQQRKYGYGPRLDPHLNYTEGDGLSDWGIPTADRWRRGGPKPEDPFAASFDDEIASRTSDLLKDRHDRPFLIGCGLFRPHTPLYATEEDFAQFPIEAISLPEVKSDDNADLPYFGKKPRREIDIEAPGLWQHDWVLANDAWAEIVQAYLAAVWSADAAVGKIISALDKSEYAENTWVILFSDHGWHLGEKEHWGKAALWEQTTRVPLIVMGPGVAAARCDAPVDLLSIYPTIMDIIGVESLHRLDGESLLPYLRDPTKSNPGGIVTTFSDHHALRTDRWRYVRYSDGSEELYDHESDPNEWLNLAADTDHAILAELRIRLERKLAPSK
ncbi:MAG: sulfatase [Verrucomicrobiota bacterium]